MRTAAAGRSSSASMASTAGAGAVRTASNSTIGSTVLVSAQGKTLYHLSVEQNGKFFCTSAACVSEWPPVSASDTNSSVSGLEAVTRPDGTKQLAYKGQPLYTFAGDKAPGEANGQGVVADGGTWSAVTANASGANTPSAPASAPAAASGSSGEGSGGAGNYSY